MRYNPLFAPCLSKLNHYRRQLLDVAARQHECCKKPVFGTWMRLVYTAWTDGICLECSIGFVGNFEEGGFSESLSSVSMLFIVKLSAIGYLYFPCPPHDPQVLLLV
jgi:hypothetical protein